MLRKIYLTTKYGKEQKEREKEADFMSHSVEMANENYIKDIDQLKK